VVDLVGQGYVDDSRDVTADRSLRSAVLVMGANHNCFNSEWTPGSSVAPSWDDWARPQDPTCGTSAPLRLSAAQQRVVGATYVAAAARAFVDRDARVVPLLDGSPVRAASAGPAVVLSHALGGRRTVALVPSGPGGVKGTGAVSAVACGTEASVDPALISCGGEFDATPHFPMDYFVGSAPPPTRYVDHVSWSSARGSAQALLPRPASLAGAGSMDLRVIVAPRAPATRFAVRVRDAAGRSAVLGEATLTGLPGAADSSTGDAPGKWWAQAVRLPLRSAAVTASGVDLRHITRIDLLPRSATGEVWVLDAWARHPGLARAENVPVVRVDLGHWRVQEGGDGRRTVRVPVTLTGTIDVPATFWIVQAARKADLPPALAAQYVTIAPGTRRLEVGLQVVGNALDDEDLISRPVYAQAVSDTVVGDWAGALDILDDDPSPSVTITSAHAVEGESLVWALSLSAPSHREVSVDFRAIPVPSGTAALATDDVPDWWLAPWTGLPSSPPVPLADLDLSLFCNVPAGQTGSTLEIPTVADDRAEGEEQVVLDVVGEVPGLPAGTQVTGTVVDAA